MTFQCFIAHFFSALKNIPLSGCAIVYSFTEGHFGCFQILAVMNKAAVDICVQVFV